MNIGQKEQEGKMADLMDVPTDNTEKVRRVTLANGNYSDIAYKKKVAIMGFAPSWIETPFGDDSFEIWTLNEAYKLFEMYKGDKSKVKFTRWFEIHDTNSPTKNKPEHKEFLKACPCPVYTREVLPEIPNCVVYPFDAVLKQFPRRYLTNSIAEMMALAVIESIIQSNVKDKELIIMNVVNEIFETIPPVLVDMGRDNSVKIVKRYMNTEKNRG